MIRGYDGSAVREKNQPKAVAHGEDSLISSEDEMHDCPKSEARSDAASPALSASSSLVIDSSGESIHQPHTEDDFLMKANPAPQNIDLNIDGNAETDTEFTKQQLIAQNNAQTRDAPDSWIEACAENNSLCSEGAEYLDEAEEEALQQILADPTSSTQLILSGDLTNLTSEILDRIRNEQQYQVLLMDHVSLRLNRGDRNRAPVLEQDADHQGGDHQEENEDPHHTPDLCEESVNSSVIAIIENFREALGVNATINHVKLNSCHPKIIEATLWGISVQPCFVRHLGIQFSTTREGSRSRYFVWEGLVEVLRNSGTLETLFLDNCDGDNSTATNWHLLARGLSQNSSLTSLTLETRDWTEDATTNIANALSRHPHLASSDFIRDEASPFKVTIKKKLLNSHEVSVPATSAQTQGPLEDSTNSSVRKNLKKRPGKESFDLFS